MTGNPDQLTRRSLLKLGTVAAGAIFLPSGCTTVAPAGAQPPAGATGGGPPWAPHKIEWATVPSTTGTVRTTLSQLAYTILVDKNPYNKSSSDTQPYLIDGGRQLIQVDFKQSSVWRYPDPTDGIWKPLAPTKAIRVAYGILQEFGDDAVSPHQDNPNTPNSTLAVAVEHILIGFTVADQVNSSLQSPWSLPDHSKNGDRFGYEITRILRPGLPPTINDQNYESRMLHSWDSKIDVVPTANSNITWGFRQMSIFLEKLVRIPFVIYKKDDDTYWNAFYYVGYEGGGGY